MQNSVNSTRIETDCQRERCGGYTISGEVKSTMDNPGVTTKCTWCGGINGCKPWCRTL